MEKRHRIHPVILDRARELRHPQTPAETTLWRALRNRQTGLKFRRQHAVDRFIIDFYGAQSKQLIEVDGDSHRDPGQRDYDNARTEYLEEQGYKVIRFTNHDVRYKLDSVVNEILKISRSRIAKFEGKKV